LTSVCKRAGIDPIVVSMFWEISVQGRLGGFQADNLFAN
jgi:hypothetical protein